MHQTTVTIYYNFPDVDLRSRLDRSQGSAAENAYVKMMMMSPGNVVFRKSSRRQQLEKKINKINERYRLCSCLIGFDREQA